MTAWKTWDVLYRAPKKITNSQPFQHAPYPFSFPFLFLHLPISSSLPLYSAGAFMWFQGRSRSHLLIQNSCCRFRCWAFWWSQDLLGDTILFVTYLGIIFNLAHGFRGQKVFFSCVFFGNDTAEWLFTFHEVQRLTAELWDVTQLRYLDFTFQIKPVGRSWNWKVWIN